MDHKGAMIHMKLSLTAAQLAALTAFLSSFEDCEQLSAREYVLDLYDLEPPMSLDLILEKDGISVEGAAQLCFDEEMDGWYIGARVESAEAVRAALVAAGALSE